MHPDQLLPIIDAVVAELTGVDVHQCTRKRNVVDARRLLTAIAHRRGVRPSAIASHLHVDRQVVYHYVATHYLLPPALVRIADERVNERIVEALQRESNE
ncbi:MAG: hypothetical protein KatS3mg038_2510 [Candidatus Kapaibacterium sp.]|nr:MAG: hypothetical protein KatS3mg038_2510 [Candidatus Kapabacteria bacterium]